LSIAKSLRRAYRGGSDKAFFIHSPFLMMAQNGVWTRTESECLLR